ncbi:MAG: selenocysteine-specific translation elongation factor [Anaerolineales bacterium]|nr:selenocysteine-specific translation elongation factor [Anaerolineales bacterium]
MYVIGTAGHVDHGKSTLVEALTGIDPDRWAEEKAREMTIDLGFAWLALPGLPEDVGVVDVPGHRDFIENMLAGIGGIDLAMLVIAADEGVMPQTREHLAILDLLAVQQGLVVLTKTDLIDDPDWLELVELDVVEVLQGTRLANATVVPVSARTGAGLPELKQLLAEMLQAGQARPDLGRPRLPIDRVFSLSGFGTVVTGTLLDGSLRLGDQVIIEPAGRPARIRGLQSHKTKIDVARPGRRIAVNLSGVSKDELRRGDVLAGPGVVRNTVLCDVAYDHLASADAPLKHNSEVKLFVGASEIIARARVLGVEQIEPGQSGWLQLALRDQAALVRGDRFILRRPSPGQTMGGGRILDPQPGRQHRRFRPELLERLRTLSEGTPAELLFQRLQRLEPVTEGKLLQESNMDRPDAQAALAELLQDGLLVQLETFLFSQAKWGQLQDQISQLIDRYHQDNPLRLGMSREEMRSRLNLPAAVFQPVLEEAVRLEILTSNDALVQRPGFAVTFTPQQQARIDRHLAALERAGVNSPSVKEARAELGDEIYLALVDLKMLQPISGEVVYTTEVYQSVCGQIVNFLESHGAISAAEVRDLLQTSRKYAIALLEHLDERRITRRVDDRRELFRR